MTDSRPAGAFPPITIARSGQRCVMLRRISSGEPALIRPAALSTLSATVECRLSMFVSPPIPFQRPAGIDFSAAPAALRSGPGKFRTRRQIRDAWK